MQLYFLKKQRFKSPLLPCTLPITSSSWVELVMIVLLCELIFTSVGVQTTKHILQETSDWTQTLALADKGPNVYFTKLPIWRPRAHIKDIETPTTSAVFCAHEPGMLAFSLGIELQVSNLKLKQDFPGAKGGRKFLTDSYLKEEVDLICIFSEE